MERFGLGPGIVGRLEILPYAKKWRAAARYHDIAYERGGDRKAKDIADSMFHRMMLSTCNNDVHKKWADFYFYMVKKYGKFFFNWHWEFVISK